MSHTVGEKAALAVKNSNKKVAVETRTPDQRLSDIRKNRAAKLFVTPDDQDFLLASYDSLLFMVMEAGKALETTRNDRNNFAQQVVDLKAQVATLTALHAEIADLKAKIAFTEGRQEF